MSLVYNSYWHEYHCTECGQVYEHIGSGAGDEITYSRNGHTHVSMASDGCHRCRAIEENEIKAGRFEALRDATTKMFESAADRERMAKTELLQPSNIGRMVRTSKYTAGDDTWSDTLFRCTDCGAAVEADDNTADGVILIWDDEYQDCPYCTIRELREADMTKLPDFGAF